MPDMAFADALDGFFHISERGSNLGTEIKGGVITFLAMCYILVVNPAILSAGGADWGGVFTATALATIFSCLLMGLYARFPVALAPGMGINAFIAFNIVLAMGFTYEQALMTVLISGIVFFLVSISGWRVKLLNSMPIPFRACITAGIGFFIALIGLVNAGIIIPNGGLLSFASTWDGEVLLGLFCIGITLVLWLRNRWGAIIIGIFATIVVGIICGLIDLPDNLTSSPDTTYIGAVFTDFEMFGSDMWPSFIVAIFSLFIVDMFDSAGTLLAVGKEAELIGDDGSTDAIAPAMTVDSVSTVAGAMLGTSTTTSFIESTTGIVSGARTGLMTVVVGILFAVALFFQPVFSVVTSACVVGALVLVGVLMMTSLKDVDWKDPVMAATAFMTVFIMGLSYSISNGIGFGAITYVGGMLISGKIKEVSPLMIFIAVLFVIYFGVYYILIPNL